MKKAKLVEKMIKVGQMPVTDGHQAVTLYEAIKPVTVTNLHWQISSSISNYLTHTDVRTYWAIVVNKQHDHTKLESPVNAGPTDLVIFGSDHNVFCSGMQHCVDRRIVDTGLTEIHDKEIGSLKTGRRMQKGDVLALVTRGDTTILFTNQLHFMITFWVVN